MSLDAQEAYWGKQLQDMIRIVLPVDTPRPPVASFIKASVGTTLPAQLAGALQRYCDQEQVTPFTLLLAAWKVLLLRYTGHADVLVGSLVADSVQEQQEVSQTRYANPIALRTNLADDPSARGVVQRVARTIAQAAAHRDYPFAQVVAAVRGAEEPSSAPIFQVMLIWYNRPWGISAAPITAQDLRTIGAYTAQCDLVLMVSEAEAGVHLQCEYDAELFEAASIRRLLGHFQTLLEGLMVRPETPISALPLLSEAEQQELLAAWHGRRRDGPQEHCVHELFEAQVTRTPDAVAVVCGAAQVTYRELNRQANQLAQHLRQQGVGPEVLVGICVDRSLALIIALLGVVKAGGAYVPLDPAYPKARLAFILQDAQVLLTQQHLRDRLPEYKGSVVYVDGHWEVIAQCPEENLTGLVTPKNLAYIIYTSGSTGMPKGIAIEHRNTVALLEWARQQYPPEHLAGVLVSTSLCFDLSVFELFVPLSWGGKIILAESLFQLPALAAAQDITLVNTVPSVLVEFLRRHRLPTTVQTVNLAGEPLQPSLVDQVYESAMVQQVYDLYGPSEDTTYSTCALRQRHGRATIGRPITNTQAYILDAYLHPVPVGIPGELHLGGAGLARGYLNRPELTATKFIPHPFSTEPGARLYKTGDLARYLPDGTLEFLGRIDQQVKIRGVRIELGEIASVLDQHPSVLESVVVAREDIPSEQRLVAYLVTSATAPPSIRELRRFLQEKLPEYMVPSAFVVLDALPLTPNGKLDRRALPAPAASRPALVHAVVAPRTRIEEKLTAVWRELFGTEDIGIHDNFFELGGHSLLAMQAVSRIRETWAVELPQRCLFDTPTIAALAETLTQMTDQAQGIPALLPVAREAFRNK